jgi:hypothetical protein
MVRAGLRYLAAADAAQLPAATQAECLKGLEQAGAIATAARAAMLAGFTAGQGYADDADYSARAWLIHHTHITSGAAVGHTAWARRFVTHPRVLAALAAEQVSESIGRLICLWTNRLPEKFREESDELLLAAAAAGLGLPELAALFAGGQGRVADRQGRPRHDRRPPLEVRRDVRLHAAADRGRLEGPRRSPRSASPSGRCVRGWSALRCRPSFGIMRLSRSGRFPGCARRSGWSLCWPRRVRHSGS